MRIKSNWSDLLLSNNHLISVLRLTNQKVIEMGCDIHLYKEKFIDGKWISADNWQENEFGNIEIPYEDSFSLRDYDLFGFLCDGVRRSHEFSFKKRGVPFDCCSEVKKECDEYGSDGHSHSYLYLFELKNAINFLKDVFVTVSGMKDKDQLQDLYASISSNKDTDWSLLYPYCQWANVESYVEFSVEVPALYKLNSIYDIVSLFDGVDGENHRIVFWFDN